MKCNKSILIKGKIRNESFMFSSMQRAIKAGLTGFVKVKFNGDVRIEAEGDEKIVNDFIDWCKRGTVWSDVNNVIVETGELKNFEKFAIKKAAIFPIF